jgi:hypothetical protein
MSPEWTRLADIVEFTAEQLVMFAKQLAGPAGGHDREHIAEQSVFLAADLALAADAALQSRHPTGGTR